MPTEAQIVTVWQARVFLSTNQLRFLQDPFGYYISIFFSLSQMTFVEVYLQKLRMRFTFQNVSTCAGSFFHLDLFTLRNIMPGVKF